MNVLTDVYSKSKRAEVMSANRSRGNRSTEWKLRARLVQAGISGWVIGSREIIGKPDFSFKTKRTAIFVDGCFWHGCTRCRNIPHSNRHFWLRKIRANRIRDARVTRILRANGWRVSRLWEHQIKENPEGCLAEIRDLISMRKGMRAPQKSS